MLRVMQRCSCFAETIYLGVPIFVTLALGSASLGYLLGRKVNEDRADSGESDDTDGDLGRIKPEPAEECKLVRTFTMKCPSTLVGWIRGHLGPRGTKRPQHDDRKNRGTVSVYFLTRRTLVTISSVFVTR